jgi:hypothetical protein
LGKVVVNSLRNPKQLMEMGSTPKKDISVDAVSRDQGPAAKRTLGAIERIYSCVMAVSDLYKEWQTDQAADKQQAR